MSAFVVSQKHISILANYACDHYAHLGPCADRASQDDYDYLYTTLARQNVRSVCHRYEDEKEADYAEFCKPRGFSPGSAKSLPAVHVLKLCDCLDYQSCETEDWRETPAYHVLSRIRDAATSNLPGYEEAPWAVA